MYNKNKDLHDVINLFSQTWSCIQQTKTIRYDPEYRPVRVRDQRGEVHEDLPRNKQSWHSSPPHDNTFSSGTGHHTYQGDRTCYKSLVTSQVICLFLEKVRLTRRVWLRLYCTPLMTTSNLNVTLLIHNICLPAEKLSPCVYGQVYSLCTSCQERNFPPGWLAS